jgi:hypothetical protein
MRWNIAIVALALLVPTLALAYLIFDDATIVVVRNTGASDIAVSLAITAAGGTTDRTEPRTVKAAGLSWVVFFPGLEGNFAVACTSAERISGFALGHATPKAFLLSMVTLDSCNRLVSRRSVSI